MNTYYSRLGRLLDERIPIRSEGYYILNDDDQVLYRTNPPTQGEIVTIESFTEALFEGCKQIVHTFAQGPDNKEVYALSLYSDEHRSFYVYLNTIKRFKETLSSYQSRNQEYSERDNIISLKYNCGDFDHQFWQEHMGEYGRLITLFEKISYAARDYSKEELAGNVEGVPIVAFETGIIHDGYYVCALKAMQQLIAENAFNALNTTDDFIAYASTGNDYLDYGILMRKTIHEELFYRVFPNVKELDAQFEEEMRQIRQLSVADSIAYWSEAIVDDYNLAPPYSYSKSELEVFVQLERFGNALAKESLERLWELSRLESIDMENYKWVTFYVEALHFSGKLTADQAGQCKELGVVFGELDSDLIDTAKELAALGSRE